MAVVASIAGDPVEARFWRGLPATFSALRRALPPAMRARSAATSGCPASPMRPAREHATCCGSHVGAQSHVMRVVRAQLWWWRVRYQKVAHARHIPCVPLLTDSCVCPIVLRFRIAAAPEPTALETGILSAFQRMPLPSAASIDERCVCVHVMWCTGSLAVPILVPPVLLQMYFVPNR